MKAGNSFIRSYYKVQMQVSKDEDNKYNVIYKDHNATHVYSKSICNVPAYRKMGLSTNSQEITNKLNNPKIKRTKNYN